MNDLYWEKEREYNKQSVVFMIMLVMDILIYTVPFAYVIVTKNGITSEFIQILCSSSILIFLLIFILIINTFFNKKENHIVRNVIDAILIMIAFVGVILYPTAYYLLFFPFFFSIRYNSKPFVIFNIVAMLFGSLLSSFLTGFIGRELDGYYIYTTKEVTIPAGARVLDYMTIKGPDPNVDFSRYLSESMIFSVLFLIILLSIVYIGYMSFTSTRKMYQEEEKLRIKEVKSNSELEVSKSIQGSMVPTTFPAFPDRKDFDIYAMMHTAKQVGGDFYDFYMVDKDHIVIEIADVSDKGVPAALFMSKSIVCFKTAMMMGKSPAESFIYVNKLLEEGNVNNMFVTSFLGLIDLNTGVMKYVNAGHLPPLVYRKGKGYEFLSVEKNTMLGIFADKKFKEEEMRFDIGDKIFLYTDGVTEARDIKEQMYGEEKTKEFLNSTKELSITEQVNKLKKELEDFMGERSQYDDITMLSFEYKGN